MRTLESPSGAGTAFHSIWRSTGPQGSGSPSAGMVVLMARVAPTCAHAEEIQVLQISLYSYPVCVIVHVHEGEVSQRAFWH